jgi:pSer/pThr/pTyr-binding forkhead associated (FHA) protein
METLRRPPPSPVPADRFDPVPLLRVVVGKDGGAAATYEFFQPVITFGRAQTADIRLDDGNISRLHCTVEIRKDGVYVRDLGSLNGVYMDGERVHDAAMITSKSIVKIGPYRFRARQESELPESRFPSPAPAGDDEWTRPGNDLAPSAPAKNLRPASIPAKTSPAIAVPTGSAAPWAEQPQERTSTSSALSASEAAQKLLAKQQERNTKATPKKAGHVCEACHDGVALTWGDGLACRACWGDGAARPRIARLGETCPCCHQGLMLKWENGMRCRNCGNRGQSTRQVSRKYRAGDRCPSCVERPLLTWKGGIRCHGCGQSFR